MGKAKKGKADKAAKGKAGKKATKTSKLKKGVRKPHKLNHRKRPTVEIIEEDILWDGWKEIYLSGTEWNLYDDVYKYDWDFENLRDEMESGQLKGKNAYFFGCTEPQLLAYKGDDVVVPIPAVVAVVWDHALPEKIGVKSVQMAEETLLPMRSLKMSWIPYDVSLEGKSIDELSRTWKKKKASGDNSKHYFLHCSQRRVGLKNMEEVDIKQYEYCLPYVFRPHLWQGEEPDTIVQVELTIKGKDIAVEYDWDMDDEEDFVPEVLSGNGIDTADKKAVDALTKAIRDAVGTAKAAVRAQKKALKAKINDIPEELRKALAKGTLQVLKFYPTNDFVQGAKSKFVNRYYGQATQLF